jgi:hypothetical protein
MRTLYLAAGIAFAAGLGIGLLIPTLLAPTPPDTPAPIVLDAAPTQPVYRDLAPVEAPAEPDPASPAPVPASPERELARLDERPDFGGRPPWWDERDGQGPPPEVRTNREAMMNWMDQRRRERANELRTNFVAQAELSDPETVRFDVLMASLNMRLKEQSEKWREAMESETMTRAEVRARAMAEISDAMVVTYDELDRNMPAGWRDAAGTNFNLMTFVEPEVWRELRPVMRGGFRGGPSPQPR